MNNVKTWYNGNLYDSKAEAAYAEFLDREKKAGRVKWWKRQVPFKVFGDKPYTVIADFLVMENKESIHEVKRGYYSSEFIYKSGLWLEQYPSFEYYILEYNGTGFTRTPLVEFMRQHLAQTSTYTKPHWLTLLLSKWFYTLASLLVDKWKTLH